MRLSRKLAALAAAAFVLLGSTTAALAITNGQPDGNNHPYVGLLVFDDEDGPAWRCSGVRSLRASSFLGASGLC